MCGIIGYTGQQAAAPLLLEGLRKLEYRGYDSAGVAVQTPGDDPAEVIRRKGKIAALTQAIDQKPPLGTCGIGHTRWATHGAPSRRNAHPHRRGKVVVVHNGIIENHPELRTKLGDPEFSSDTDSEVVAHLIEADFDAQPNDAKDLHLAVRAALEGARGAWALCVMHDDFPGEIVVARQASPLLIGLREQASEAPETFIASDAAAILVHTRLVVDLEDGDTAHLDATGIKSVLDGKGKSVRRRRRQINWSPMAAEKQGFKHFMLKEIFEQPRTISDTMRGAVTERNGQLSVELAEFDASKLGPNGRIIMLACGTSWHAALAGKYLVEQIARVPVEVDLASEYRYRNPIVREGDVALAISQSGETADTLAALREAMRLGATGLAICNVVDSTIARAADNVLYTRAGPEISVASTKAFTTQLTALCLLAIWLGRQRDAIDAQRAHELLEALSDTPAAIDDLLEARERVQAIADKHHQARDMLYLGRGLSFPVALEGALKLKEISYLHAEGYAAGEMKHGPIALIDENMPVVILALQGPGYDKTVANLEAVRSRGGQIVAVATRGDQEIESLADDVIWVPSLDPFLQPMVANVPLQLLAYYIADHRGTDVDQPRNLAKSVTVE
jgi:glucosamine--fructose-6-phosphate aminotransferase (isomerizing)